MTYFVIALVAIALGIGIYFAPKIRAKLKAERSALKQSAHDYAAEVAKRLQ